MGLNDDTINDPSLSTNEEKLSLVNDATKVILIADDNPFDKKDLKKHK
jgi:hypothetical protein